MKKFVLVGLLLFFFSSLVFPLNHFQESTGLNAAGVGYDPVAKHFVDESKREYEVLPSGLIKISKDGERIGFFGFAITGKVAGENQLVSSKDFNWTWSIQERKYLEFDKNVFDYYALGENQSSNFPIQQIWDFNHSQDPKIKYNVTNNFADVLDAKFWFINIIKAGDTIEYNEQDYTLENDTEVHLKGNFNSVVPKIKVNDSYYFNYKDLLASGFDITDVIVGKTNVLGDSNLLIVAIGVTKGAGNFLFGQTIELDPGIQDTGHKSPNTTGDPHNDWANPDNVKVSDDVYAVVSTDDLNLSISDFNFLDTETGGEIPIGARIRGIEVRMEAKSQATCSEPLVTAFLSSDGGVTETIGRVNTFGSETTKIFGGFYDEDLWGRTHWDANDLSNENFRIRFNARLDFSCGPPFPGPTDLFVDHVTVKVGYLFAPDQNIITEDSTIHSLIRIAISDADIDLNTNTIVIYAPHDLNTSSGDFNRVADFSANQFIGFRSGTVGSGPQWDANGAIGGSYDFNVDNKDIISWENSSLEDLDANFTLAAWIWKDSLAAGVRTILDKGVVASTPAYRIAVSSGQKFNFRVGGGIGATCTGNVTIPEQTWTHVVATYDGNQQKVYVNGEFDKACSRTVEVPFVGSLVRVGCMWSLGQTTACFNGKIDEVLIVDKVLDDNDIKKLYDGNLIRFFPTGEIVFRDQDISGDNRINLQINSNTPHDSNISVQIGNQSGADYSFGEQFAFTDGNSNDLPVVSDLNFAIKFRFFSGRNDVNTFISPVMENAFISTSNFNCNYGGSGDYNLTCNKGCVITESFDLEGNDFIINNSSGAGTVILNADLNRFNRAIIESTCRLDINGTRFGGGT